MCNPVNSAVLFRTAACAALALCVVGFSTAAFGVDDKAETLVRRAIDLRRSGDDKAAYPLFVQAHELTRSPRTAGQLGLCEQALGRWEDAETHVTEALKSANDPWVTKNRPALEGSLVTITSRIARIEVIGEPSGAEVLVNGVMVGRLPMTIPARAAGGEIAIELRAPGHARASKTVRVEGGQYRKVLLSAEPQGGASLPVTSAAPPSAVTTPAVVPAVTSNQPNQHPSARSPSGPPLSGRAEGDQTQRGSVRRTYKWIAWGAAAASLGVGIYGTTSQMSAGSDFDAACGLDEAGVPRARMGSGSTDARCAGLNGDIDAGFRVEVIGLAATALLGAAGVALWLTEPPGSPAADGPRTSLACLPDVRGNRAFVGCAVRF